MSTVLWKRPDDLSAEKAELLASVDVDALRERAASSHITYKEALVLRRLEELDFLLG